MTSQRGSVDVLSIFNSYSSHLKSVTHSSGIKWSQLLDVDGEQDILFKLPVLWKYEFSLPKMS